MIDPEVQQVIDSLESRLGTALYRIRELEDSFDAHHGLDNGSDEVDWNTPHRNLSVDTIESGGAVIRQDRFGMQLKSDSSTDTVALFIVPELLANPDDDATLFAYVAGTTFPSTEQAQLNVGARHNDTSSYVADASFSVDNDGSVASLSAYFGLGDLDVAYLRVHRSAAGSNYVEVHPLLNLNPQAANPTVLADGDLWYHSTDDKVRARINGVTTNLATEAFASAEVTTHTGDTSDAHDASSISVLDAGGYFTGTDVEAALQELGAAAGGGSMPMPPIVSADSWHGLGTQIAAAGLAAPVSAVVNAADRAIYIPMLVTEDITVTKLWCYNGATVSGNVNMALYTSAFAQVANSEIGSTAQAGTNAIQEFDITNVALAAGLYYVALVINNGTGTFFRYLSTAAHNKAWGMLQEAAVFDLPATATPVVPTQTGIPICGIATRTQVA